MGLTRVRPIQPAPQSPAQESEAMVIKQETLESHRQTQMIAAA